MNNYLGSDQELFASPVGSGYETDPKLRRKWDPDPDKKNHFGSTILTSGTGMYGIFF
jgi:hypothetical protein